MSSELQYWRLELDRERLRKHRHWNEAGRQGAGRLEIDGKNLRGAPVSGEYLVAARLARCDLGRADLSLANLSELELEDCRAEEVIFARADLTRAHIRGGSFVRADCRLTTFSGAQISAGDWSEARLDRAQFEGSLWTDVVLARAPFWDATLSGDRLIGCDLRGADLSRREPKLNLARCKSTLFERCDLRGVNWTGRRLAELRFVDCKLADMVGKPVLEGAIEVVGGDVSEADLLARWR